MSAGHYAVFDAYYDLDSDEPHRPTAEGEAWAGLMSLNFCPPELVQEEVLDDNGEGTGEYTMVRRDAKIDIDKTVFQVNQAHTLTAEEVEIYDFLKIGDGDDADTQDDAVDQKVWWLRPGDDIHTEDVTEEASDLQISFSTELFDAQYWAMNPDDIGESGQPLQYVLVAERQPGVHPREYGHVYIFDDSMPGEGEDNEAICNTRISDTCIINMAPGQLKTLQWVFTDPRTYVFWAYFNGHVRHAEPTNLPDGDTWHPVSERDLVTSESKQYVFHAGDLTLNPQPVFLTGGSVDENTIDNPPADTPQLIATVQATQDDSDPLEYTLSGPGYTHFTVETSSDGHAQIFVAAGTLLDHEVQSSYDLRLGVSDRRDREGNVDSSVDQEMAVRVSVSDSTDDGDSVTIHAPTSVTIGDTLLVRAYLGSLPGNKVFKKFVWTESASNGDTVSSESRYGIQNYSHTDPDDTGIRGYSVRAYYGFSGVNAGGEGYYQSSPVYVNWTSTP